MITDRIRNKAVNAGMILNRIESMQKDSKYDSETLEELAKNITGTVFMKNSGDVDIINDFAVNEPFECAELLRNINQAIDFFYMLEDKYYTKYIFNSSTDTDEDLEKLGITEEWCSGVARKLEQMRNILYGDNVSWDEIAVLMMRNAAYSLREDNHRLESRNRTLEFEMRKKEQQK